ncbi:MAG: single-stranded-DNA-specific exonuclease RecJ, partial [Bacteroidales bacterium]|nr:single-stranded-DNA-specific exonuclease RecJ [Bacteroidales bacterium]
KREDCDYPFDDLSGCGVGFKLVQAYSQKYNIDFETLIPLLDILAVSIASDLVSMVGENRVLAHFGLKQINENPCKGLLAMIQLSNVEPGHVTVDDIVFKIGPRINAAGRMESGRLAVELLKATDMATALKIGEQINESNNERKNIDREITQEALEMAQNNPISSDVTIVYNPLWNKGVVGIVASRLVEAYYRPAIVLTKSNGFITGSARSIGGFDLYEAIESCSDLLENFGGHIYAAGLTLREENFDEFTRRISSFIEGKITKEMLVPVVEIDAKLDFAQITPKFFRILKQFQPFGPGNNNPVFMTDNVYDAGTGRKVGAGGLHMKLDLIQETQPYHQIPSIAFNMAEHYDYIREGNPIDICYAIVENYYRGNSSIQLRLRDLRERDEDIL